MQSFNPIEMNARIVNRIFSWQKINETYLKWKTFVIKFHKTIGLILLQYLLKSDTFTLLPNTCENQIQGNGQADLVDRLLIISVQQSHIFKWFSFVCSHSEDAFN